MQCISESSASGYRSKRRNGGFTLVELLVVIVVLAILAAIVLPKFMDSGARSREAALKSNLKLIRNAITIYKTDTGLYPVTLNELSAAPAPAQGNNGTADVALTAANWHGPYLQATPTNPVLDPVSGNAYTYTKTTGTVVSSAVGNALDGTAYSSW
ncbi:MAG: prepilin-type N-terminal cleavage/methylation domain-containing protein [Armatimonadetes bacterium]|nr:prepilin-type N-terminal cleavage/methylation domain-containing protein [Armatimonadota bacterium]